MYRARAQPSPYSLNNVEKQAPYRPTFNAGKKQTEHPRGKNIRQAILRMDALENQQSNNPRRPTKYKFASSHSNQSSDTHGMSGAVYRPTIPEYQQPQPYTNSPAMYDSPYQSNYNPHSGMTQGFHQYTQNAGQMASSSQWNTQMNYQPYQQQQTDVVYQQQTPYQEQNNHFQPQQNHFQPQQPISYEPINRRPFYTQPVQQQPEMSNYQQPQTSLTQAPPKKEKKSTGLPKADNSSDVKKKPALPHRVFLSVNIHGIHEWSKYKSLFLPIFEIIGTLDCQVTTTIHGKSFTLRDGQNRTIDCVFYETDRPLPAMKRRVMYRCVGEFNSGLQVLLCVSIRPTSDSEIQAHRKMIAVTNLNMKKRVSAAGLKQ